MDSRADNFASYVDLTGIPRPWNPEEIWDETGKISCGICSRHFSSMSKLKEHKREEHSH